MSEAVRFNPPIDVGQGVVVRLAGIRNSAGNVVDPATVVGKFVLSGGTATSYTYGSDEQLEKNSTGDYQFAFTPDAAGTWYARIETTSPDTAYETSFAVAASQFG